MGSVIIICLLRFEEVFAPVFFLVGCQRGAAVFFTIGPLEAGATTAGA